MGYLFNVLREEWELGNRYVERGEAEEAIRCYDRALEEHKEYDSVKIHVKAAEVYYHMLGREDEAKQRCKTAVDDLSGDLWRGYALGGYFLRRAGMKWSHMVSGGSFRWDELDTRTTSLVVGEGEVWPWKDELVELAKRSYRQGWEGQGVLEAMDVLCCEGMAIDYYYEMNDWQAVIDLWQSVATSVTQYGIEELGTDCDAEMCYGSLLQIGLVAGYAEAMLEAQQAGAGNEQVLEKLSEGFAAMREEFKHTRKGIWDQTQAILRDEEQVRDTLAGISANIERNALLQPEALEKCGREIGEVFFGVKWERLPQGVRLALATAELVCRQNRDIPGFSFAPVVVEFCKALELQLKAILAAAGIPADLATLGEICSLVQKKVPKLERAMPGGLSRKLHKLVDQRNSAAHEDASFTQDQVQDFRNEVFKLMNRLLDITA